MMPRQGILLIESSGSINRVGLYLPDHSLSSQRLTAEKRHARDLVPAIRDLLQEAELLPRDLEAIGVSIGPGGYTGLRVGLTAAKTLAFATGAVLHAIPTFDWLVECASKGEPRAVVLSDALKEQVYSEIFERNVSGHWQSILPLDIRPLAAMNEFLKSDTLFLSEAKVLAKLPHEAIKRDRDELSDVEIFQAMRLSVEKNRYRVDSPYELEPLYVRGSSAEEKAKKDGG